MATNIEIRDLVLLALLVLPGIDANSATLTVTPPPAQLPSGTQFDLLLGGAEFPATIGGTVSIRFDNTKLELAGIEISSNWEIFYASDYHATDGQWYSINQEEDVGMAEAPNVIESANLDGRLQMLSVGMLGGFMSDSFQIATLSFLTKTSEGAGQIDVLAIDPKDNKPVYGGWLMSDYNTSIPLKNVAVTANIVATPIPAALWLLLSAITGLLSLRRP